MAVQRGVLSQGVRVNSHPSKMKYSRSMHITSKIITYLLSTCRQRTTAEHRNFLALICAFLFLMCSTPGTMGQSSTVLPGITPTQDPAQAKHLLIQAMGCDSGGSFVELSMSPGGGITTIGLHRDRHNWDDCQALCAAQIDHVVYMPNVSLYYALGIPNEAAMDNIRVTAVAGLTDSEMGLIYFDGILTEWTSMGTVGVQYDFRHFAITGIYATAVDRDYAMNTRSALLENNLRLGVQALGLMVLPGTHTAPIRPTDYVPRRAPNELNPNLHSDGFFVVDPLMDSLLGGEWGTLAAWTFINNCVNYLSVCESCPCVWDARAVLVQGVTNVGLSWIDMSWTSFSTTISRDPAGCPGDLWRNRLTVTISVNYGLSLGRLGIFSYTHKTIVMQNEATVVCAID